MPSLRLAGQLGTGGRKSPHSALHTTCTMIKLRKKLRRGVSGMDDFMAWFTVGVIVFIVAVVDCVVAEWMPRKRKSKRSCNS